MHTSRKHWSCKRKHRHNSRAKAERVLKRHIEQFPHHAHYVSYFCTYCKGFHIGRSAGIGKYYSPPKDVI